MADVLNLVVPQTLEGWYILHDVYRVEWACWRSLEPDARDQIAVEASRWMAMAAGCEKGDSALYSILTQKGDLMFLHYRETPEELNRVELSLRQTRLFDFLTPAYSFLSVLELGLHELTGMARQKLADQGIFPGAEGYDAFFDTEMEKQQKRVGTHLFADIPYSRYVCFYPMNKRRSEAANWYLLPVEDRRELMREHSRITEKYHDRMTQVIGGAIGLEDWEWGISLHADDCLVIKKLVHEMRFNTASAVYEEFGPFYTGIRVSPERVPAFLSGQLEW